MEKLRKRLENKVEIAEKEGIDMEKTMIITYEEAKKIIMLFEQTERLVEVLDKFGFGGE